MACHDANLAPFECMHRATLDTFPDTLHSQIKILLPARKSLYGCPFVAAIPFFLLYLLCTGEYV